MDNDLGFGTKRAGGKKLDLSGFSPRPEPEPVTREIEARADKVAERVGFVSREPTGRVQRIRPKAEEPIDQIAIKGPLSVLNRFREYANDSGLTYAGVLARLLDIAESRKSSK